MLAVLAALVFALGLVFHLVATGPGSWSRTCCSPG